MSPFDTTAPDVAGVRPGTGTGAAVELRGNIFEMTQAAENAVLRPVEPGAFAHDLRAALAARIARLSGDEKLAEHHLKGAGEKAAIADPSAAPAGRFFLHLLWRDHFFLRGAQPCGPRAGRPAGHFWDA